MNAPAQKPVTTVSAKLSATEEKENRQTIAAALETYRIGFLHLDAQQLKFIWDRQHQPLIYIAQEKEEPINGWDGIQKNFAARPENLKKVFSKNLDDLKIDVLGETAIAHFTSRSIVRLKRRPTKYEPISHVTMIFHLTPDGWRAIHYHESARSE
jgi:ketosteroid isomerase-like protein